MSTLNDTINDFKNMNNEEIGKELQKLKDECGLTYTQIADKIGYNRANISNFANQFVATDKVKCAVIDFLNNYYSNSMTDEDIENLVKYKTSIEIYPTEELIKALGFLDDIKKRKKMGCMIGAPGCGKTTAIDEYCKRNSNVIVIEACSGMRENDLLDEIADGLGISLKNGSPHKKITQIIKEYGGLNYTLCQGQYKKRLCNIKKMISVLNWSHLF